MPIEWKIELNYEGTKTQKAEEGGKEAWGWTRRQRVGLGILVFILVGFLVVGFWRRGFGMGESIVVLHGEPVTLPRRVDPNVASLEELMRVPHIGEKVAGKLVEYREARKGLTADGVVFRSVEDLGRIPGLGKKMAGDLGAYFEFPADAETEPGR